MAKKISPQFKSIAKILTLGLGLTFIFSACGKRGDRKVYFGNLENYAQVESPFKVQMKAENLIVEPAIMGIREGAGHFHIIVDGPLSPPGAPIAKNESHIHYGNGESETTLDLPVGEHTLVLQFSKGDHIPYDPPLVQLINITVTKQNKADSTVTDTTAVVQDSTAKALADSGKVMADTAKVATQDTVKAEAKSK